MPDLTPYEQAALNYCAPHGIPLSVFRDVWSHEDQAAALEWQRAENLKCPGCGQPRTEAWAHEDDAPEYKAEVLRCHACKVREIEEREFTKDGNADRSLYVAVGKAN